VILKLLSWGNRLFDPPPLGVGASIRKLVVGLLWGVGALAFGQDSAKTPSVQLESVRRVRPIQIRITLQNPAEHPIFVAYCGRLGGQDLLCVPTTGAQEQTEEGWETAYCKARSPIGAAFPDRVAKIDPKASRKFIFEFDDAEYCLRPGRRARIAVAAWSSEAGIKTQHPELLFSEPFDVPAR
jgi:hypothetical protein